MSGPTMKWVMSEKDGKTKFADMPNEKKWFLACLAWEANHFDNRICAEEGRDIATLAAESGVSIRAARRHVKAFVDEGVLEAVGRTGYHNRVVIYRFTMARRRVAAKNPVKRATNGTIQDRSNGATDDTIQADSVTFSDTRNVPVETFNSANGDTRMVPKMTVNSANGDAHYIEQELPINLNNKNQQHNAHRRAPSPVSQAKPGQCADSQTMTDGAAQQAAAMAMVNLFYSECEANVREEVEQGCMKFATQGLTVDDMRSAIRTAKRENKKLDRKPRWASVRNALDAIVRTRASVIDSSARRYPPETIVAARALEAVYERYLAKPPRSSNVTRVELGELFCRCARSDVDEATFEAACLDVKEKANGKPPTWRKVRDAIDSRKRDGKPFFDRPAERRARVEAARRATAALLSRLMEAPTGRRA